MDNQSLFDPLNSTPEEHTDMLAGYLAAGGAGAMPDLASQAFEHGWRMRRNDKAGVVDDDQKQLARLFLENERRTAEIRKDADERRQRLRGALREPSKRFKL